MSSPYYDPRDLSDDEWHHQTRRQYEAYLNALLKGRLRLERKAERPASEVVEDYLRSLTDKGKSSW